MLSAWFHSGLVAGVGILMLLIEAVWWQRSRGAIPFGFLASGALLLAALGLALRQAPVEWIGLAMAAALIAHVWDLRSR